MGLWKSFLNHVTPTPHNAYRPHLLRPSWLGLFLAVVLAVEGFLVANLVARQTNNEFLAAVIGSDLIRLTNAARVGQGETQLHENVLLDAAAQAKANDMAANGYFSHTGPDGKQPWDWINAQGYHYQYAGENLAVRFVDSRDVVNAWMASPSHRANIVKPQYTDIGIGVANGIYKGQPATFVVEYLGAQQSGSLALDLTSNALQAPYSTIQSLMQKFARIVADPANTTALVLGGIATLLLLVLLLAFLMHVEVQSREALLGGAVVAAVALLCIAANAHFLTGAGQTANAFEALGQPSGVVIGDGVSTQAL